MDTVILVIHLMVAAALVAVILLQRSEGGALGMGGGGGGGGFMSGRGVANFLTRLTAILAAGFFMTSIVLTILARQSIKPTSILDNIKIDKPAPGKTGDSSGKGGGGGILPKLRPSAPKPPAGPQVPQSQ